ncbi:MAG: hypothetical protein H6556_22615 [Lewinellaceae bacterium]|nr:hypothetical protein [Lewinellaceae bacterium]
MKNQIVICLAVLCATALHAQEKVRYTDDFQLARGIYTSLQDFKSNQPVKPSDIITDIDASSPKFFQFLLAKEDFRFPRNNEIVYLKPREIFGYSDGRQVYYGLKHRFEVIGKICLLREVDVVDSYSSFINPGDKYEAAREEGSGKLYIMDFETGDFFRFKPKMVEAIFQRDEDLFREYQKAKGKKKDKALNFIKEYNFKHPVYFPR